MIKTQYFALVLAVVIAASEANSVAPIVSEYLALKSESEKSWDGLGLTADANHYVDTMIEVVKPFMHNYRLDPFTLPDLQEGFSIKVLLITYSAWLELTQGSMTGLSNIQRSGDQMVYYFAKMLRVRVELQFNDIEFVYRYSLKVMNLGPRGGVIGSLDKFKITCDVIIDFNNDEVQLQEFAMGDIGRVRVRLTGNSLIDWMLNPTIGVIVRLFNDIIMRIVASTLENTAQFAFAVINEAVKVVISTIENY